MSIFEVSADSGLVPFRRVLGGPGQLYEDEVEALIWENSEELTGEGLFPIARTPKVIGGGVPDIVALDADARVVVIEVKRDVDRAQLAQCLEYAGWARTTNLDELARMYHGGEDQFFEDWREFTDGGSLRPVATDPRLILVARDFRGRTKSALEFLIQNGLPVDLVTISVYEDEGKRRFLDVGGLVEAVDATEGPSKPPSTAYRRVTLADLFENELLVPGDEIVWERPRLGQTYSATITDEGTIRVEDGRTFTSPSGAAKAAAGIPAYNGWVAWSLVRNGKTFQSLWEECQAILEGDGDQTYSVPKAP